MLMSIVLAIVIAFAVIIANLLLNNGGSLVVETAETSDGTASMRPVRFGAVGRGWILGICVGLIVGVINYITPKLSAGFLWLAPIFLVIMAIIYIYLMAWWRGPEPGGSNWRELIAFIVIAVLLYWPMKVTAVVTTALWDNLFWTSLVWTLPLLFLVAAIGFFIIDICYFRWSEMYPHPIMEGETLAAREMRYSKMNRWLCLGRAAIALTTLIMLAILFFRVNWENFSWPSWLTKTSSTTKVEEPAETAKDEKQEEPKPEREKAFYAFYNLALLNNDDDSDNFNFGYNPRKYHPEWEEAENAGELFNADFRERMAGTEEKGADVALGTAAMAWLDANVGTRYLGEFYESCMGDWAKTINEAKVTFMKDQELYEAALKAFFKYLDEAKVEIRDAADMDDQMYMNPYTVDGVPDIIVMKTEDHTGKFLVYTFVIKDKTVEVAYRIDCGYQPTNVEKVMKITPVAKPETPTKEEDPPKKEEDPPQTTPKKDPTKGTQGDLVKPNDDPGPGPDTNNGVGATESTQDLPTNSNHETYEEYKEDIKELEEINETQKTGDDSNEPSTKPPTETEKKTDEEKKEKTETNPEVPEVIPETKVDNNGDKGNGGDGINVPTPEKPLAEDSNTEKPIVNDETNPAGVWEGPPED